MVPFQSGLDVADEPVYLSRFADFVSAGAIIPIMPVEKSPAPRAGGVNPESGIQRREYMCLGGKTWTKLTSSNEKD
jgi:hypothetical protein